MPDKNLICVPSTITYRNIEIPDDLQACHDMNRKNQVIIKFKCRKEKYCVLSNCKTIQKKKKKKIDLTQLKFSGKLLVNENMRHENH